MFVSMGKVQRVPSSAMIQRLYEIIGDHGQCHPIGSFPIARCSNIGCALTRCIETPVRKTSRLNCGFYGRVWLARTLASATETFLSRLLHNVSKVILPVQCDETDPNTTEFHIGKDWLLLRNVEHTFIA